MQMIILLGPDHTGKTRLAHQLEEKYGLKYFHYGKDDGYEDYLKPMCSLDWWDGVLDRHAICEYAYSQVMNRGFKFTMKQWHNIILTTLIQNPMFVLCVNKPPHSKYDKEQYLPYEKWDRCLGLYRHFLNSHHISYLQYDYQFKDMFDLDALVEQAQVQSECMTWWKNLWQRGWGCIGSTHPKVLLVAERIGPNNMNNIPFETGPTGLMLTDLLAATGTPLGVFAVTNYVKSYRRDKRAPNEADDHLLRLELEELKPEKVILMGSVAKDGAKVVKEAGIDYIQVPHFGSYSHKGSTSIAPYIDSWRKAFNLVPSRPL
jgi:hypothetical protein